MTLSAVIVSRQHERVRFLEVEIPGARPGDKLAQHLPPGAERVRVGGTRRGRGWLSSNARGWVQRAPKSPDDVSCSHSPHPDRRTQHGAFESGSAIDATHTGEFTHGIQTRARLSFLVEHAAGG